MAAGYFFKLEHCWAKIIHPFINLDLVEFLFSPFKAQKSRFHYCHFLEVRFQCSWFMKLMWDSCRSSNVGCNELWIMEFHHVLNEILWIEVRCPNVILLDPCSIVRFRLNHCCFDDVHDETNTMIYHSSIFVKLCSCAGKSGRTMMNTFKTLAQTVFDLLESSCMRFPCFRAMKPVAIGHVT